MTEPARSLPALTLAVVGVRHPNKDNSDRRFFIRLCVPGEPVELRPEPKNEFDEHAVAVFTKRGKQIGYLAADRAPRIGALIRQGRELQAVFQAETQFGAWIRVAFDGEVPVLPSPAAEQLREGADLDPDFYPDEEWPDE
jgi:hypothetical protein